MSIIIILFKLEVSTVATAADELALVPESNQTQDDPCTCTATTLTTGAISVLITALLVTGISVAIHITAYQCVYKPRLTRCVIGSASQKVELGDGDASVYDHVGCR